MQMIGTCSLLELRVDINVCKVAIADVATVQSGAVYGPLRRKPTHHEKSFVVSAFCKPRPAENTK